MTYKRLKIEQLNNFKRSKDYTGFVQALNRMIIKAFGDIRNLVFDKIIGTNILSDLIRFETQDDFIHLLKESLNVKGLMVENIANVPCADGTTVTMKVF